MGGNLVLFLLLEIMKTHQKSEEEGEKTVGQSRVGQRYLLFALLCVLFSPFEIIGLMTPVCQRDEERELHARQDKAKRHASQ